jgi:transcriptional regulator with XRE-family HTH domain
MLLTHGLQQTMSNRLEKRQRLAELLKRLISDKNWSERELARQLGISPTSVQAYVDGVTYPGEENRANIARLLGMTREELDAELEAKPVRRRNTVEEVSQEIRAMNRDEFAQIARVVFDRTASELSKSG